MTSMSTNPAQSKLENAVPRNTQAHTLALIGSTAPSKLPVTEPTNATPRKYSPNDTNVPKNARPPMSTSQPNASMFATASGAPAPMASCTAYAIPEHTHVTSMPTLVAAKLPKRSNKPAARGVST